ncbi:LOW QUALITY PROTEIN: armadillo repeat-containing protein 2 [Denticeps clupeoides]|uniref:LOW QUALITY PROTEIN: armadillo repeat-containing protein 2 n=1 Tax=Denticeps clupeoides TaxID=299321 RepID=UPI0010A2E046|nr:LOW QUALITY PROTEIN: armadillo repeat-containing protein 2 [Denticeps clupeoides]
MERRRVRTSSEIVSEARNSLRTLSTRRPFTPQEQHRQLFGGASSRPRDARPPSASSLRSQHFEVPDSRPSSRTRLSPLDHKPKLAAAPDQECWEAASATLSSAPPHRGRGSGRVRPGLSRTSSLGRLPPVSPSADGARDRWSERASGAKRVPSAPATSSDLRRHASSSSSSDPDVGESPSAAHVGEGTGSDATEDSAFWNAEVLPVLQEFEAVFPGGGASEEVVERLCVACTRLHGALRQKGMLGRKLKKRAELLKSLFRLIDLKSERLNLQLGGVILDLDVSGKNLLNVCKLVFIISRSAANDVLFNDSSIIDSLLCVLRTQDVCVCGEALLYCSAALKFLSGNGALRRLLLEKECISVLSQLTQQLTHTHSGHTHTVAGHILVQLTATLRNMADLPESRPTFLSNRLLPELCVVLEAYHGDPDICINVARIFSKLSSYRECCVSLAESPGCYRLFITLMMKHGKRKDLLLRVLFTMGNLAGRSSEARLRLFEEEGCVSVLLGLFHSHLPVPAEPKGTQDPAPDPALAAASDKVDILVKLIRVLANMSVHPTVGSALAADTRCIQLLLQVLEQGWVDTREELMLNAAAAVNNLTFYQGPEPRGPQAHASRVLFQLLLSPSMACALEATRAFGNLSRAPEVRRFIVQREVLRFLVPLLDSSSADVCFSACGVLVNLSAEPRHRRAIREQGAFSKLTDCLRDLGPFDWQLAAVVCQTLWNLTEEGVEQGTEELLNTLHLYLDEEAELRWSADDDAHRLHRACWELEFRPVAEKLRTRILHQMS